MITVFLAKAILCIGTSCYPALVGPTPIGTFQLQHMQTDWPGYGGDVLVFDSTPTSVYAIHRTYTLAQKQHRQWRLKHGTAAQRHITNGCVNVAPEVYRMLPRTGTVRIEP